MENKERALAHIEKIEWIKGIDGANNIELIGVLGWVCIAKKGEFKVGDLAVYIEIDSLCPKEDSRFDFLENKHYKIKTMKLGKFNVISQGLAMPVSLFPELSNGKIGENVTKTLKITYSSADDIQRKSNKVDKELKYKSMAQRHNKLFSKSVIRKIMKYKLGRRFLFILFGRKKDKPKQFPSWIIKTDEKRCENYVECLKNKEKLVQTEKIDGCLRRESAISTNKGELEIGKIVNNKLNVKVLSYNEATMECEYKDIIDYHKIKLNRPLYQISVGYKGKGNRGKSIYCTNNHKFLTKNGWKRADELTKEDLLMHYSKIYDNELDEILIGCLLGDSSLTANSESGNYRSVVFCHSTSQQGYFEYKQRLMGGWFIKQKNRISGYGSEILRGILVSNTKTWNLLNKYFPNNCKKIITQEFANAITPLSLAFWYMDDGYIKNRETDNLQCRAMLCTQGYSYDENVYLQTALLNKFNISTTIGDKDKYKGYVLCLDVENTSRLCSLIVPYVCKSMKYKLPKKYEDVPCIFENYTFNSCKSIVETKILDIQIVDNPKDNYVYDLTIKDNHNYFAKNILVHNCSCTYAVNKIRKNKYEFIVCSRNVRQMDRNQSCYHEANIYWELADKYNIQNILTNFAKKNNYNRVVLQGEGVGNVQGNPYKLEENDLYVFNLVINGIRTGTLEMAEFCDKNGLKHVPIISTEYVTPDTMEELKLQADGKSIINPNIDREGFVYRSLDGQTSFKNVSRKYLLKHS